VTTQDGRTVEAGTIGRCGMVGIPILLGTRSMPGRIFVQIPGSGFRISAEIVGREFDRLGEFRRRLLRYLQARIIQTSQSAACNRLHGVDQRLARWLLLCSDQMDSDRLLLTQEFLGQMLGAPRTTVTLAAGMLQKAGLIESSRGALLIVNRKGLEDVACECYGVISAEYARLTIQ
jgi:CRP-like cAMP-binding protein